MNQPKISIIVAVAGKNRVIGKKGGLPWYIPEELKKFKNITMGHPVIMGRKTHESIGRPLPGRTNIVITHDPDYSAEGCMVVHSFDEALRLVFDPEAQTRRASLAQAVRGSEEPSGSRRGDDEVFVIGGGQIYEQALPLAEKLYLTYIDKEIEGDVFFPDYSDFKKVVFESDWQEYEGLRYKFLELEKP